MPEQRDTRTLEEALRETAQAKWQGRRCYATNMSQATKALADIAYEVGTFTRDVTVDHVTSDTIKQVTARWYARGLSPATINKRLNCLSAMGVAVEGCRVREPKVLKWWLKPDDEDLVCRMLLDEDNNRSMAALIRWTTRTGLRIEESLRLRWRDVDMRGATVTVPGLKTANAQATLPLGPEARAILSVLGPQAHGSSETVFGLTYEEAERCWRGCRVMLGVSDTPTATLKALRRSAARHLHITKGMPLDMVRQYLRHEDMETTLGYLRLTGGYGTEEMRKWL